MTSKRSGQCQLFISLNNNWAQYKCGSHKAYFVPKSKKSKFVSVAFNFRHVRSTYISDEPVLKAYFVS